LTNDLSSETLTGIMNRKTIKTDISKMLRRYPEKFKYQMVATELGISVRYVRYLETGDKSPSEHLRRLIKLLLGQKS